MDDVRALKICYRLLSRMEPKAQRACMDWLEQRLASDRVNAKRVQKKMSGRHKVEFRRAVGQMALDLIALTKITGGTSGKRSAELRGAINADVQVCVRPV